MSNNTGCHGSFDNCLKEEGGETIAGQKPQETKAGRLEWNACRQECGGRVWLDLDWKGFARPEGATPL